MLDVELLVMLLMSVYRYLLSSLNAWNGQCTSSCTLACELEFPSSFLHSPVPLAQAHKVLVYYMG